MFSFHRRRPLWCGAGLLVVLASFGGAVAVAQDEPAEDPAAEAPTEPALPPQKRVKGKTSHFAVSRDGSAVAISVKIDKTKQEIWHFEADAAEGRNVLETEGWILSLTLTPNGRFAYLFSWLDDPPSRYNRSDVIRIGEEITRYGHSGEPGENAYVTVKPGPGDTHVTLSGNNVTRVVDLETGDEPPDDEIPPTYDGQATSADGRIWARTKIYDVLVNETESGKELLKLKCDVTKKSALRYWVMGLSETGDMVVLRAYKMSVPSDKRKHWLEGWDVTTGKRRWKVNANVLKSDIIVGPDRVATLVGGRLKLYDIHTGRAAKLPPMPKPVKAIGAGGDLRTFWAATVDGRIIPVR